MMGIVAFGELLIDFVSLETGVSVGEASGFEKKPGGAPANVAVAAAKLGQPSAFLGQVGDDPFGYYLEGVLRAEGVNTRGLRFSSAARTALAFVSLRADGERSFVFYRQPSADMLMTPDDVALDVIDGQDVFHFGSITLISEPSRSATLAAVNYARERGLFISYDPNLRLSLWSDAETARAGLLSGLPYADLVKVSDEELDFLTGGHDVTPLWRDGMKLIVVTHGAGGATLYTRTEWTKAYGFTVNTVDTTGAGDGFVAGLLVGIIERGTEDLRALDESLYFACAVGALTTTARGAIPALPTRAQVEAFLNRKRLFGIDRVEDSEGELHIVGRVFEELHVGDTVIACAYENAGSDCATFRISKINFLKIEVESLGSGYTARVTLEGEGIDILKQSKYLFAEIL